MKKLYNEFFYIPKYGKIREKAMLVRTAMTVVVMVICLAAMSLTAYAYFSYNVTSGSNIIKAANFEAQIVVTDETGAEVTISKKDGLVTIFDFENPGTYTVKLTKGNSSAGTGFCIVHVGDTEYHTQQIGIDINANNEERDSVSFQLKINEAVTVGIESHWGTSSFYGYTITGENEKYIVNSDPLKVIVVGTIANNVDDSEEDKETVTTPETTEPTETEYTVIAGDTLSKIAAEYNVTVAGLKAYNELTSDTIVPGQTLKIPPADYKAPEETTQQTTTPTETTTPATETTEPAETTAPETTSPNETTGTTEPTTTEQTEPTEKTESVETTGTDTTAEIQPATENTETTGAPTTEANE